MLGQEHPIFFNFIPLNVEGSYVSQICMYLTHDETITHVSEPKWIGYFANDGAEISAVIKNSISPKFGRFSGI